ncbi:MAG TPA: CHAT domain-containing protein [Spirochaetota bacterium]|nr:CHAT domain-containing protein [Spirochaetota bacterium]
MAYIICTDSENLLLTKRHGLIRISRNLRGKYDLTGVRKGERIFLLDFEKNRLYGPFYSESRGAAEERNPKGGPFNGFGQVRNHYLYDSIRVDSSAVGKTGMPFDGADPKTVRFLLNSIEEEEITHKLLIMNTERVPLVLNFTLADGSMKVAVVGLEGETFVKNYTCSAPDTLFGLIDRKMRIGEDLFSRGRQKEFISSLIEIGDLVYSNILQPLELGALFSEGGYRVYIAGEQKVKEIPFELSYGGSFIFEKNCVVFSRERAHGVPGGVRNEKVKSALVIADPTGRFERAYKEGIALFDLFEREGITADLVARPLEQDLVAELFTGYGLVHFSGHTETEGGYPGWDMGPFRFHASDLPSQKRFPSLVFSSSCKGSIGLGLELLDRGAITVLCSRWQVPDIDMSEFVLSFYKLLLSGVEAGEAFNWIVNRSYESDKFIPLLFSLHGHSRIRYEKQYS